MPSLKKLAEQIAGTTGAEKSAAYVAARVALEAIPTPAGTRWDYYAVPDELAAEVSERAAAALNSVEDDGTIAAVTPVAEAQRDYDAALEAAEHTREQRDDAIRAARAAGVPIAELQRATGLGRQRVSTICSQ